MHRNLNFALPSQVSSLPCFSVAMLPIHIIAFASRCHPSRCLCSDSPRRRCAHQCPAVPLLCNAVPSSAPLCSSFANRSLAFRRISFAFLPTANLCLCSGSPYRRGSVLGWSKLCRRRAAPCVVWLFNAVACHSSSDHRIAVAEQIPSDLRNAVANLYSANQRPCPTKHLSSTLCRCHAYRSNAAASFF